MVGFSTRFHCFCKTLDDDSRFGLMFWVFSVNFCFCCYFSMTFFVPFRFAAISLYNASQNSFTSFICAWLDMTSFKLLVFDSFVCFQFSRACLLAVYLYLFAVFSSDFQFSTLHKNGFLIMMISDCEFDSHNSHGIIYDLGYELLWICHSRDSEKKTWAAVVHMLCTVQSFARRSHRIVELKMKLQYFRENAVEFANMK